MKNSFFNFIIKQINKPQINRMPLNLYVKAIRKLPDQISTQQLIQIYRSLQKIKFTDSQFNLFKKNQFHNKKSINQINEIKRQKKPKQFMAVQSYQKQTIMCLQQIVIQKKQKNGYQQTAYLIKLHYLRLLRAIQYNLPYINILQQFREQFLFSDIGNDIIDYIDIISKNPSHKAQTLIQTVNIIIQVLNEELDNLQILDLPTVKIILIKGLKIGLYNIDQRLLNKIDDLILKNKHCFSYKDIEHAISHQDKNIQLHRYYSFMVNDLYQKRLNYMCLEGYGSQINKLTNRQDICIPGKAITTDHYERIVDKIQDLSMYKPYLNIFELSQIALNKYHQLNFQKQQPNTYKYDFSSFFKYYINYHFNYLKAVGFVKLQQKASQICVNLQNIIFYSKKKNINMIKSSSIETVNLLTVSVCLVLKRPKQIELGIEEQSQIQPNSKIPYNNYNKYLDQVISSQLQKPQLKKIQQWNIQIIRNKFKRSLEQAQLNQNNFDTINYFFSYFYQRYFEQRQKQNTQFQHIINDYINNSNQIQKKFITNQFLLFVLLILDSKYLNRKQLSQTLKISKVILDLLSRNQYKKYSQEFSNIQKIIHLLSKQVQQIFRNQ